MPKKPKYQVFVYRDGRLLYIGPPHHQGQARNIAAGWQKVGYDAQLRPVDGAPSVKIGDYEQKPDPAPVSFKTAIQRRIMQFAAG